MDADYQDFSAQSELLHDLRAWQANILGFILSKVAEARDQRDFDKYFSLLDDLYTRIAYKLIEKEIKEYLELRKKAIETLNKYSQAYKGKHITPEAAENILDALGKMDIKIISLMDKHKFFGKAYMPGGL